MSSLDAINNNNIYNDELMGCIKTDKQYGKNLVINDAIEYLKTNTFVPHESGNYGRYGLNFFGCDSIIQYNNDNWKFIWFITNTKYAVYVNKDGCNFILQDYMDGITRMQVV